MARLVDLLAALAEGGLLRSAHDIAEGGLALALAECCLWGDIGARVALPLDELDGLEEGAALDDLGPTRALFGEAVGRAVISCDPDDYLEIALLAMQAGVACTRLGTVGGAALEITAGVAGLAPTLAALRDAYEGGLARALAGA